MPGWLWDAVILSICYASISIGNSFEWLAGESSWLQNGYKKFEDAVDVLKYMDYSDKKRIESTFYYPKSKPDTRVGMKSKTAQTRMNTGFLTCHFAA